jgi:phosphatidylserine decarboxylase
LHGKWKQGYLGMILVGALNVGRIVVKEKLIYATGEEIGYFSLGSTIVLLIESPNMEWNI